ncbi:MAG: hypothetical protein JO089_00145, partial [Alphaproteobacteria bacterium]|nr:hypothetical protein [Alphaproteobacteria bacterium]
MEDFLTGILTWLKQLLSAIGLGGLFGDDKQAAPGAPPDPDAAKKAADAALQAKDKTVGDVDTAAWAILKADKPSPDQISDLKAKAAALNTLLDDPDYQKSLHDTARLNRKGDIQFAYEHVLAAARKADVTLEGKLGAWQANDKAVDEADATARAILKANDPSPDQINDLKAKAAVLNTLLGDQDYQKKRLEDGMDLQDFRNVETDLLDAARKANVTLDGKLGALQAGDKTFTDLKTTIEGINTPGHQLSDEEKATLQSQLDALSALLNADEYIHTLVTEETMDTNGRDRGKTYAAVFMGVSAAAEKAGIALTENMRKKVNFLSEYIVSVAAQRASGNMEPSPDKDKEGFGELLKNVNSILKDKAYMDSLGGADSDERKAFDAKIKCITDAAKAAGIDLKEYDKLAAYAPPAPSNEPPPPQPPPPAPAAPAIDQNNLKAKLETIYTANLDPAAESVFNNYGGDR